MDLLNCDYLYKSIGKTSAINLGSVISTYNKSIILKQKSGKHFRHLPIFPGMDIPANLPQGPAVQWSISKNITNLLSSSFY